MGRNSKTNQKSQNKQPQEATNASNKRHNALPNQSRDVPAKKVKVSTESYNIAHGVGKRRSCSNVVTYNDNMVLSSTLCTLGHTNLKDNSVSLSDSVVSGAPMKKEKSEKSKLQEIKKTTLSKQNHTKKVSPPHPPQMSKASSKIDTKPPPKPPRVQKRVSCPVEVAPRGKREASLNASAKLSALLIDNDIADFKNGHISRSSTSIGPAKQRHSLPSVLVESGDYEESQSSSSSNSSGPPQKAPQARTTASISKMPMSPLAMKKAAVKKLEKSTLKSALKKPTWISRPRMASLNAAAFISLCNGKDDTLVHSTSSTSTNKPKSKAPSDKRSQSQSEASIPTKVSKEEKPSQTPVAPLEAKSAAAPNTTSQNNKPKKPEKKSTVQPAAQSKPSVNVAKVPEVPVLPPKVPIIVGLAPSFSEANKLKSVASSNISPQLSTSNSQDSPTVSSTSKCQKIPTPPKKRRNDDYIVVDVNENVAATPVESTAAVLSAPMHLNVPVTAAQPKTTAPTEKKRRNPSRKALPSVPSKPVENMLRPPSLPVTLKPPLTLASGGAPSVMTLPSVASWAPVNQTNFLTSTAFGLSGNAAAATYQGLLLSASSAVDLPQLYSLPFPSSSATMTMTPADSTATAIANMLLKTPIAATTTQQILPNPLMGAVALQQRIQYLQEGNNMPMQKNPSAIPKTATTCPQKRNGVPEPSVATKKEALTPKLVSLRGPVKQEAASPILKATVTPAVSESKIEKVSSPQKSSVDLDERPVELPHVKKEMVSPLKMEVKQEVVSPNRQDTNPVVQVNDKTEVKSSVDLDEGESPPVVKQVTPVAPCEPVKVKQEVLSPVKVASNSEHVTTQVVHQLIISNLPNLSKEEPKIEPDVVAPAMPTCGVSGQVTVSTDIDLDEVKQVPLETKPKVSQWRLVTVKSHNPDPILIVCHRQTKQLLQVGDFVRTKRSLPSYGRIEAFVKNSTNETVLVRLLCYEQVCNLAADTSFQKILHREMESRGSVNAALVQLSPPQIYTIHLDEVDHVVQVQRCGDSPEIKVLDDSRLTNVWNTSQAPGAWERHWASLLPGFSGVSSSAKSSILHKIFGFYDVSSGCISIYACKENPSQCETPVFNVFLQRNMKLETSFV